MNYEETATPLEAFIMNLIPGEHLASSMPAEEKLKLILARTKAEILGREASKAREH